MFYSNDSNQLGSSLANLNDNERQFIPKNKQKNYKTRFFLYRDTEINVK